MKTDRKLYILCGGQSRRMGRDKAMLDWNGETLLALQIKKGVPFFDEVILLAGNKTYPVANRHLNDAVEDAGPLGGLLAALKDGADHSLPYISIMPVDLPGLSAETFRILSETSLVQPSTAAVLGSGDDLQPLAGVYSVRLIKELAHYLETGNRMVFGFLNRLDFTPLEVPARELLNINRPGDVNENF